MSPRLSLATLVVSLTLLVVAGCAALGPQLDPPQVSLESFRSVPTEGGAPRFEIKLRVANPNTRSLDIAGISYSVAILDRQLISGVTSDVPVIAGYSEEVITLEAGLQVFSLLQLLAGLGATPSDSLPYKFSAKIDFNGLTPTQRIEESGEFTLR